MKSDEYGMIMNSALSNFLSDMVSDARPDDRKAAKQQNTDLQAVNERVSLSS